MMHKRAAKSDRVNLSAILLSGKFLMKKILISAAAIAFLGSAASAGGLVAEVPPVVIVEDTASSNQGIFVPIFALVMLISLHHGN